MQCNVGGCDKTARIVIGVVLIGVGAYYKSWWGLVGLVPLITALLNYCPLYAPLGISTCEKEGCCSSKPGDGSGDKPAK